MEEIMPRGRPPLPPDRRKNSTLRAKEARQRLVKQGGVRVSVSLTAEITRRLDYIRQPSESRPSAIARFLAETLPPETD